MTDFLNSLRVSIQEALQKAFQDENLQNATHQDRINQLEIEKELYER